MRRLVAACALATLVASPVAARAQAAPDDAWLGRDKALHFGASAGLAATGHGVSALWLDEPEHRALAGAAVALTAGAAKELWDATGRGDPSWKDAAWDVVGAVVGVALALAVDRLADQL